ncbi:TetR/AcrR family transcriptional regulator [Parabacteroides sp. OttesenSCG-928-K15]|nr:TetR/AcrR family transcriptional regulator [Parabacteroides sp. OttesenSCG-928-K15]
MNKNRKDTKNAIIQEAFKLFSNKPYDQVTLTDIEHAINLSRGAITHHFKSKQEIFDSVIESAVLGRRTILDIPIEGNEPLKSFIKNFVDSCKDAQKEMNKIGIKNMNLAHYNIESQALYFYSQFDKLAKQMRETELKRWTFVVKRAQEAGEIKSTLNAELVGCVFLNTYLGHAYSAAKDENGCNTQLLLEELMCMRNIMLA